MSSENKNYSKVWLSLAFYIAYFTYFISYAYEINYIITYTGDLILLFSILACSFTSILFTSTLFMVLTMLLICFECILESYIFIVILSILKIRGSNFLKCFYFLRFVVIIFFTLLFWLYMRNLKSEKQKKIDEMKQMEEYVQNYNNKLKEKEREKEREREQEIERENIRIANMSNQNAMNNNANRQMPPQYYSDPNQMNMMNGHYYQVPMNNPNMMYNQNMMYNPNMMNNQHMMNNPNMMNIHPVPLVQATGVTSVPINNMNNVDPKTSYPYGNMNNNGNI